MPICCESYCSHGGRCHRPPGHDGPHSSSGYCTWTDAEALTRQQADAVLAQTREGAEFLAEIQPSLDFLEWLDE